MCGMAAALRALRAARAAAEGHARRSGGGQGAAPVPWRPHDAQKRVDARAAACRPAGGSSGGGGTGGGPPRQIAGCSGSSSRSSSGLQQQQQQQMAWSLTAAARLSLLQLALNSEPRLAGPASRCLTAACRRCFLPAG